MSRLLDLAVDAGFQLRELVSALLGAGSAVLALAMYVPNNAFLPALLLGGALGALLGTLLYLQPPFRARPTLLYFWMLASALGAVYLTIHSAAMWRQRASDLGVHLVLAVAALLVAQLSFYVGALLSHLMRSRRTGGSVGERRPVEAPGPLTPAPRPLRSPQEVDHARAERTDLPKP